MPSRRSFYPAYTSPAPPATPHRARVFVVAIALVALILASVVHYFGGANAGADPADPAQTPVAPSLANHPESLLAWANEGTPYRYRIEMMNASEAPLASESSVRLTVAFDTPSEGELLLVDHQADAPTILTRQSMTSGTRQTTLDLKPMTALAPNEKDTLWLYSRTPASLSASGEALTVEISAPSQLSLRTRQSSLWGVHADPSGMAPQMIPIRFDIAPTQLAAIDSVGWFISGSDRSGPLSKTSSAFEGTLSPEDYPIGTHRLHAAALLTDGTVTTSAPVTLNVSAPVYVVWSFDWEGNDVSDDQLARVDEILGRHNNPPLVHFFSPRIFIASEIPPARATFLADWVRARSAARGDEIQLHLHMQEDQWRAIGVEPKSHPKWSKYEDGYDVMTFAYTYDEFTSLLGWAKDTFVQNDLPLPTGYRAGGWMADGETLRALADTGFAYDASGHDALLWGKTYDWFPWKLNATTQPYFPDPADQNKPAETPGKLLEFPNNAGDTWYFESKDLIAKFSANYDGTPQQETKVVSYVSHPQWIEREGNRMDQTLSHIDQHLASNGTGPVVYVTYADIIGLYR